MKKYSTREKRLLKWAIFAILFFVGNGQWKKYQVHKADLLTQIEAETSNRELYTSRLQYNKDKLINETEESLKQIERFQDRVIYMKDENEANFKFQEDISDLAERADVKLSSSARRRSEEVWENSGLFALKTTFNYDGSLADLIGFFEELQHAPYFVAVETLTINSYSNRRRSRRNDEQDYQDRVRGNALLTALYKVGEPNIAATAELPDSVRPPKTEKPELDPEDQESEEKAGQKRPEPIKRVATSRPVEEDEEFGDEAPEEEGSEDPGVEEKIERRQQSQPQQRPPSTNPEPNKNPSPEEKRRARPLPPRPKPISPTARN